MIEKISALRKQIKEDNPLVHCIMNPIAIHACANVVLAAGARPIMAEHPAEAAQITASAASFTANLGNPTDARMEAIRLSMREAKRSDIPSVLDLVGVACSPLRLALAEELIRESAPSILKGNVTELRAAAGKPPKEGEDKGIGIDASKSDELTEENLDGIVLELAELSAQTGSVVLASGKQDLIICKDKAYLASNGVQMLSKITGTGCMLGALCGVFLAAKTSEGNPDPLLAAVAAVSVLNIAGEEAQTPAGPGTFQIRLLDALYTLEDSVIYEKIKVRGL